MPTQSGGPACTETRTIPSIGGPAGPTCQLSSSPCGKLPPASAAARIPFSPASAIPRGKPASACCSALCVAFELPLPSSRAADFRAGRWRSSLSRTTRRAPISSSAEGSRTTPWSPLRRKGGEALVPAEILFEANFGRMCAALELAQSVPPGEREPRSKEAEQGWEAIEQLRRGAHRARFSGDVLRRDRCSRKIAWPDRAPGLRAEWAVRAVAAGGTDGQRVLTRRRRADRQPIDESGRGFLRRRGRPGVARRDHHQHVGRRHAVPLGIDGDEETVSSLFAKVPAAPPAFDAPSEGGSHGHGLGASPRELDPRVNYLVEAHDGEILFYYSATPLVSPLSSASPAARDAAAPPVGAAEALHPAPIHPPLRRSRGRRLQGTGRRRRHKARKGGRVAD